jgi:hypothetical protein
MLWLTSNKDQFAIGNSITDIDEVLHKERLNSAGKKRVWYSSVDLLPNGAFVQMDNPNEAWLVHGDRLIMWHPAGYAQQIEKPSNKQVAVLTPESIVRVLAAGYEPVLHSSSQTPISSFSINLEKKEMECSETAKNIDHATSIVTGNTVTGSNMYRLTKTPSGKRLYTYFAAILEVTGMSTGETFPLKRFIKNFSGHEQSGRISKTDDGYQLTPAGIDYFSDRYNPGNPQHVESADVKILMRLIRSGDEEGWEPI